MSASEQMEPKPGTVGGIAGDQLLAIIQRVERLNEEKKALNEDIAEVFGEARSNGFDVKVIKHLIKLRSKDKDDLDQFDTMVEVYARAIGMFPDIEIDEREAA